MTRNFLFAAVTLSRKKCNFAVLFSLLQGNLWYDKRKTGGRTMEHQEQIQKILEKMEENSRKQLFYSRIQFVCTLALTVCCVLLLVRIRQFLPQLELLANQAEQVLTNLEAVTGQLQKLDMVSMVENINSLVATSQVGVEEALGTIKEIKFDTLNQAIEDLAAVVQPMADFVKRLGFGGR